MKKLFIFIGMAMLGWLGGRLGAQIGTMTSILLSGVGSMAGVYLGWRIHRDLFE